MKEHEKNATFIFSLKAVLLIALCTFGSACGDTAARQLASETVKSIDSYQGELNKKSQAENNFYAVEKANIEERLFGCTACTPAVPVTESLYYNDLVMSAQREGLILAENFVETPTKGIASGTVNYVSNGLSSEAQLYSELLARQDQLNVQLGQNIEKLQSPATDLTTVRSQATLLATDPGTVAQLNSLYQLGAGVSKILQANKAQK
jgi:hypothetical protein